MLPTSVATILDYGKPRATPTCVTFCQSACQSENVENIFFVIPEKICTFADYLNDKEYKAVITR